MTARGRPRRRQGRGPASRRSLASTPDACGALKSRASPRSSPRGTPRRQAPAQGRPRCRRERRLRLGLDVLRHRDKGVEVGAVDVLRRAHRKRSRQHADALRRRRGARARTRRGDGLGPRDEFVYARVGVRAGRPLPSGAGGSVALWTPEPSQERPPRGALSIRDSS